MDFHGSPWCEFPAMEICTVRISGYGNLHGANLGLWKFASAGVPFKGSRLRATQGQAEPVCLSGMQEPTSGQLFAD